MPSAGPHAHWEVIHHLPGLAQQHDESYAALGGSIERLAFEEFEKLEDDWAHENYYDRHTTVWRAALPAQDPQETDIIAAREKARLVQLAAAVVCEAPLPDPILSIIYVRDRSSRRIRRTIGVFERTWFLSKRTKAAPTQAQWQEIARKSDAWHAGGLSSESAVFQPVEAYGAVFTSLSDQPALMMMPVVVALEGMFAPGEGRGIVRRMTANLARVLPDATGLADRMRELYAIRSDIVHGRNFSAEQATAGFATAGWLACRATSALASAMAEAKSSDPRTIYGAWD